MQIVNGVVMLFVLVGNVPLSAQNCPVDTYSTNSRNAIRMCGASVNQVCPVILSSINMDKYPATNAVDNNINTITRTESGRTNLSNNPHWLRVDLEKNRLISQINLWIPYIYVYMYICIYIYIYI